MNNKLLSNMLKKIDRNQVETHHRYPKNGIDFL